MHISVSAMNNGLVSSISKKPKIFLFNFFSKPPQGGAFFLLGAFNIAVSPKVKTLDGKQYCLIKRRFCGLLCGNKRLGLESSNGSRRFPLYWISTGLKCTPESTFDG